ncbi:response regulator transcription factor [Lacibacter sp.]|uniref:response regulator transcription factor n=1 Tax=Lacibacter sp. TaxID=1915409 RepID=UPI002B4B08E8|nr:response regulator transcription factor [Lacibacter sp.]HLP39245.1 response regulator transcription factor [Lacibacter sp.]
MEKITVLIADDHKLIRETWSFILNSDPRFTVIAQCSNGEEAIEMAQKLRPKIALLDINMAPMNGIEATEQIRKFSPSTKIIGVSMHSQPAYVKKLLKLGAMGYVTKNSPQQEMFDAIAAVHEGKRYICAEVKTILSEQIFEEESTGANTLSTRELDVIKHIKEGLSSKEISTQLNISLKTVEVHRHNILKKLNLKNSAALVNYINSSGLVI